MAGLYYEDLHVGRSFSHAIRRTVTEADNVFFSALTHNPAALHLDEDYCREHSEFGTRVVNSAFTLGLMVGISVAAVAIAIGGNQNLTGPFEPERVGVLRVSSNLLPMLGAKAALPS